VTTLGTVVSIARGRPRGWWLCCPACGRTNVAWRGRDVPMPGDPSGSLPPSLYCLDCGADMADHVPPAVGTEVPGAPVQLSTALARLKRDDRAGCSA
jgi:hypothetical protein